jgi:hypothetical protein
MVLALTTFGWIVLVVVIAAVAYSIGRWVCAPYYAKLKDKAENATLTAAQLAVKQTYQAAIDSAKAAGAKAALAAAKAARAAAKARGWKA